MTAGSPTVAVTPGETRRVAAAGGIGTVLEWYDYGLYGTASALVITPLFFADLGEFAGQLASFATFAVGFVARPIGGIALGILGDRIGRKKTLLTTIWIMGLTTFLVGCLPTSNTIGIVAPILLVLLRLIQGFGAGAELAGALTYVSESTASGRRGFYTSFSSAASVMGTFVSTGVFAIVVALTTQDQLLAWGWRIPFLVSAIILIVAFVIRTRLEDSPEFQKLQELAAANPESMKARTRVPLWDMLRNDTRSFFSGLLAPTGLSVVAYVTSVFGVTYIVGTLKMPASMSLVVILSATAAGVICTPFFGILADRIGAKKVFIFGAVFGAVFAFPFFLMLGTRQVWVIILAVCLNYGIAWGATAGSQGLFLPALFRTRYRFTGVATSRELNSAIFAGPAPLIAAALVGAAGGRPWLVAWMLIIAMAITILGVVLGTVRREDDVATVIESDAA